MYMCVQIYISSGNIGSMFFVYMYAIEFIAHERSPSRLMMSYLYKNLMLSIRGNDCIAKNARQNLCIFKKCSKKEHINYIRLSKI